MYNILVCDDERDIVSALRIYLEAEDYQVFEAYDSHGALELFSHNEIHLITEGADWSVKRTGASRIFRPNYDCSL